MILGKLTGFKMTISTSILIGFFNRHPLQRHQRGWKLQFTASPSFFQHAPCVHSLASLAITRQCLFNCLRIIVSPKSPGLAPPFRMVTAVYTGITGITNPKGCYRADYMTESALLDSACTKSSCTRKFSSFLNRQPIMATFTQSMSMMRSYLMALDTFLNRWFAHKNTVLGGFTIRQNDETAVGRLVSIIPQVRYA